MSEPKIPKGWRKMRAGEIILSTDKFWSCGLGPWTAYSDYDDNELLDCIGKPLESYWHAHIRLRPSKKGGNRK